MMFSSEVDKDFRYRVTIRWNASGRCVVFFVMMLILEERHVRTSSSVVGQGLGVAVQWFESECRMRDRH